MEIGVFHTTEKKQHRSQEPRLKPEHLVLEPITIDVLQSEAQTN